MNVVFQSVNVTFNGIITFIQQGLINYIKSDSEDNKTVWKTSTFNNFALNFHQRTIKHVKEILNTTVLRINIHNNISINNKIILQWLLKDNEIQQCMFHQIYSINV